MTIKAGNSEVCENGPRRGEMLILLTGNAGEFLWFGSDSCEITDGKCARQRVMLWTLRARHT